MLSPVCSSVIAGFASVADDKWSIVLGEVVPMPTFPLGIAKAVPSASCVIFKGIIAVELALSL